MAFSALTVPGLPILPVPVCLCQSTEAPRVFGILHVGSHGVAFQIENAAAFAKNFALPLPQQGLPLDSHGWIWMVYGMPSMHIYLYVVNKYLSLCLSPFLQAKFASYWFSSLYLGVGLVLKNEGWPSGPKTVHGSANGRCQGNPRRILTQHRSTCDIHIRIQNDHSTMFALCILTSAISQKATSMNCGPLQVQHSNHQILNVVQCFLGWTHKSDP